MAISEVTYITEENPMNGVRQQGEQK